VLPRFRLLAVSMQRLQIRRARSAVLAMDMVHRDAVVMLAVQPPVTPPALLPFEPPCQCGTDHWMPALSCAPGHPIAIVRTAIALDVDMSHKRDLAVSPTARRVRGRRRGGQGQACAQSIPVAPGDPSERFARRSPAGPGSELDPGELIEPSVDGLPPTGAGVGSPAPDCGVELANQPALRPGSSAFADAPTLRQMVRHIGLGGLDQGCVPEASRASGAFTRLVCVHPILPAIATQERQPGLSACPGMAKTTCGFVHPQAPLGQPGLAPLVSVFTPLAGLVQHPAIIGVGANPSWRVELGESRMHPMEGNQRQQRGTTAALGRSSWGRPEGISCHETRLKPSCAWSANAGGSWHFGPSGLLVDPSAAWSHVDFARLLRSIPHRHTAGADGILPGPSRATALGMG
jgi:hypothetical protein